MNHPAAINMTPHGTTIKDIKYHVDRLGVINLAIEIDPPIAVALKDDKDQILKYSIINIGSNIEPGYDQIGIGSVVNIIRIPTYTPDVEDVKCDNGECNIISTYLVDRTLVELKDNSHREETGPRLMIEKCPACGHHLNNYNGQLICNTIECPAQILERCTRFIRLCKMHLHGIYYMMLCLCISRGYIKNPADIFFLTDEQLKSVLMNTDKLERKYIEMFKRMVDDVIGKVTMTQLLLGLNVISTSEDPQIVRNFVSYQNEGHQKSGLVFDIPALIKLVDHTVKKFALIYNQDDIDSQKLSVNDQLMKLSDKDKKELEELYGNMNTFNIASLIDYVLNKSNREVLQHLHDIHLLNLAH